MYTALRLALIIASVALAGGPRWAAAEAQATFVVAPATIGPTHADRGDSAAVRDGVDESAPVAAPAVDAVLCARPLLGAHMTARAIAISQQRGPATHQARPPHDARGPPIV